MYIEEQLTIYQQISWKPTDHYKKTPHYIIKIVRLFLSS